jgi:hypothetical protein
MPRQTYKIQIQKDTNTLLEESLLQSLLFDDDELNQEKPDAGEIDIVDGEEGGIAEEEIYEICEVLAVALPHIRYLAPRVSLSRGHDFWDRVSEYPLLCLSILAQVSCILKVE